MCRTLVVLLALLLGACQGPTSKPLSQDAQRICHGGDVVTLGANLPQAEALALRDGRILAVGDVEAVFAHRGPGTEVIDLQGQSIYWAPEP